MESKCDLRLPQLAYGVSALALVLGCNGEAGSTGHSALQASPAAMDGAPAAEGAGAAPGVPATGSAPSEGSPSEGQPNVMNGLGLAGSAAELPPGSALDASAAAGDAGFTSLDAGVPTPAPPTPVPPPLEDPSLPLGVVSRFPSAGRTGVCRDVPLRLTFANDVALGNAGSIRIFTSAQAAVAVDAIDMAATAFPDTIAARPVNRVRPVFLEGRDAVVYFRHDILQPNTSYFVTIDAGVFVGAGQNRLGVIGDQSWSFSTGAAPAAAGRFVVQREGEGDFCTLQGALDAVPANNDTPVRIDLRNGTYHEMAYVTRKNDITLSGEDRDATIVAYPNNNNLNAGTAARSMVTAITTDNLVIENLTLFNTTPQGGSQAEALRVRGNQAILRNANFLSLQDTLLLEGRVYIADSYVEGNVDFVWGQGTAYFERSEIKLVGRSGVIVQSRNGAGVPGYIFVDSRLTSDPGITGSTLARIDATVYPSSQVAFINCQMGPHISPAGWTITPAGTTATGALQFWEFQSTDLSGRPLDVSQRDPASRQITAAEAAGLRNRAAVLGGWDPTL
jgi:hypothetical protein